MKKKFFSIIVAGTFAGSIALNTSLHGGSLSDMNLANIEALSNTEGGGKQLACYQTVSSNGIGNLTHQTYCADCEATLCRSWSNNSFCTP